jgi:hypothetical protein
LFISHYIIFSSKHKVIFNIIYFLFGWKFRPVRLRFSLVLMSLFINFPFLARCFSQIIKKCQLTFQSWVAHLQSHSVSNSYHRTNGGFQPRQFRCIINFTFVVKKKQQQHHLQCDEKAKTNKSIILSLFDLFLSLYTIMKSGSCKFYMNVKRKYFALVVRCLLVVALVNENTINISM